MSPLAPYNANVLLAAVAALSAAIAFVAALHLYARCFLQRRNLAAAASTSNPHATMALQQRPPDGYELEAISVVVDAPDGAAGLGAKELCALQVLVWESPSSAKAEHCAVCLGEMEDGELGRLLPACRHVFHVGCIDAWLRLSSTCPVCRSAVRTEQDAAAGVHPLSY
uniref:Uncharacterized protein n=1 Tax=Avena sativa TaxID=4498 RepID=A0ACD5TKU3_AVESA